MSTETLGPVTVADRELPKKKGYVVERPRVPLVLKLFGLTALLIALVVAVAVGITIQRANSVAQTTVNTSITGAAKLFKAFETQRLRGLESVTRILGSDPNFVAYIQSAISGGAPAAEETVPAPADAAAPAATPEAAEAPVVDLASINDTLLEQRERLGTDVMMLLDDQGILIARTDQPMVAASSKEDLYTQTPLVRKIVDDASVPTTSGVLRLGGKLFHAAVAPLGAGARDVRIGYLINAFAIDETFANRIAESTNAGVVFTTKGAQAMTVRSSSAPSVMPATLPQGKTAETTVDQSRYILTTEPLQSGTDVVGSAIFLRSLDRELAPFREIENAMLIGGGAALLLAFLFSWVIAKRMTRPIEQLAGIAQAVTAGDYSVDPPTDRNDEVGILGRSFGKMMNSLRDKAELEQLYAAMAEKSDEMPAVKPPEAAKRDEGTVLVTDLRGLSSGEGEASDVMATVEKAMRIQQSEVTRQDGSVREIDGHRLVSIFRGDRGVIHAIRAARAINEELAIQFGSNSGLQIGIGIATGEFVTGSINFDDASSTAIVGNAPLLALLFAWHAPHGYAYVSYDTAQVAGGEVLATSTREEVRLKWLAQPLAVAALPLVSVTTGMMRSIGGATSTMATIKMDATAAGVTAPASPYADLSIGHLFNNRYRIEQILGRGGMGVVYKANDTQLDETVAIKTLPGDVMTKSPEDLERFKREIRLARRITHRNVLRTFDYGEADGVYYISMEYVRGYTLSELLDEAPQRQMPSRAAVGIARQICRGLHAAHEQGIIHRDIKPGNVLIDAKGEVKLMDFGIARMAETPEGVTQAGLIVGTPHYMSPEQVQGKQLDARSDVYSMGVLIYELLVGKRPFESSSLTGVLTAHITEAAKPPVEVRPDIGREVSAIIMRCLAKDPKARYADAGALLADLDKVQIASAAQAA